MKLEEELEKLEAERNRLYWMFCRYANGKPVPATLTRRIYELRELVKNEREKKSSGILEN